MTRLLAGLMMIFALSGCSTYSLQELRQTTPSGSDYHKALSRGYLDLAQANEERYNWSQSMFFADKGLLAAYGQEIGPEAVDGGDMTKDEQAELEKARIRLLNALTPETIAVQPENAADAQVNFDCWLEYKEEGLRDDLVKSCHERFEDAVYELENGVKQAKSKPGSKLGKAYAAATLVNESAYIIYFAWGQTGITDAGETVIGRVMKELEKETAYEIVLNGHTDTTGSQEYNQKLSNQRALAVKDRLVEKGVKGEKIKVFAFGESDPAVKTADGEIEPLNRRVQIFIDDK